MFGRRYVGLPTVGTRSRGFRSEQGVVGAVAYRRKVLVIDFVDGRSVPYRALNCKPGGGWVDDAVASLNQQLSALRP